MDYVRSRRLFMRKLGLASAGISIFSSSNVLNAFTLDNSEFPGYNPYSEAKTDLRLSKFSGKHITVEGTIYCKDNLNPLDGVKMEVWHLSPNSAKYRHQAKLMTNKAGEYSFITDFPGREAGKMSRIYLKISNRNSSYSTELLMNDTGAHITGEHWGKNNTLGEKLFPVKEGSINASTIVFNISI